MSEHTAEIDASRLSRPRCTAFPLDNVCPASDPCQLHGCTDIDSGDASGCYCDPERVIPPGESAPDPSEGDADA